MKTHIKKITPYLLFALVLFSGLAFIGGSAETFAAVQPIDKPGLDVGEGELVQSVKNIINFVLGVVGLVAVAILIYAGIQLTASAGNDEAKEKAKKIITYTIIGLVIVALSWVIVEFVTRALIAGDTGQRPV